MNIYGIAQKPCDCKGLLRQLADNRWLCTSVLPPVKGATSNRVCGQVDNAPVTPVALVEYHLAGHKTGKWVAPVAKQSGCTKLAVATALTGSQPIDVVRPASFAEFNRIVFSVKIIHPLTTGGLPTKTVRSYWTRTNHADVETRILQSPDMSSAILAATGYCRANRRNRFIVCVNDAPVYAYDSGKVQTASSEVLAKWDKEMARKQELFNQSRQACNDGSLLKAANRTVIVQNKPTLPVRKREPRTPQLITHMGDNYRIDTSDLAVLMRQHALEHSIAQR